ncbi:uncharacterized protein YfaQ (DUF2300 family) [Streptacidiphilus sp. MAP12-16]
MFRRNDLRHGRTPSVLLTVSQIERACGSCFDPEATLRSTGTAAGKVRGGTLLYLLKGGAARRRAALATPTGHAAFGRSGSGDRAALCVQRDTTTKIPGSLHCVG